MRGLWCRWRTRGPSTVVLLRFPRSKILAQDDKSAMGLETM